MHAERDGVACSGLPVWWNENRVDDLVDPLEALISLG